MLAFLVRRALQALLVMLVVALIAFTLFRFVGDPINQMVGIETSQAERAHLREALGLNDPGQIVGYRNDDSFIANAVPEPAAGSLAILALAIGLCYCHPRRRGRQLHHGDDAKIRRDGR